MKITSIVLRLIISLHILQAVQTTDGPQDIPTVELEGEIQDHIEDQQKLQDSEDQKENEEFMELWSKDMQDFEADEMMTFEIEHNKQELLLQNITQSTMIRGVYFISFNSQEKADLIIIDPSSKQTSFKIKSLEGYFLLNATEVGEYGFLFSNLRGKQLMHVTFILDIHNITETHLSHADINPVERTLEHIASGIKDYQNEQRFASMRQINQMESIQEASKRLMFFSMIEILVVVLATSWQIYYIKKILDNKRMI